MAHTARTRAVTILDAAIIVLTSAAVVLLLGGPTRGALLTVPLRPTRCGRRWSPRMARDG